VRPYWQIKFPYQDRSIDASAVDEPQALVEELKQLLIDAVRIRLRADVPVGAYLSGGLDSSIIAYIVKRYTSNRLVTFSIEFTDEQFDESGFQLRMAEALGTDHQVVRVTPEDIGRVFPDVIWHTEVPVTRTAPAPMFLLSQLVRSHGYKVVLTGEGADEFLAGYDLFKEAAVRRFWARQPQSRWRPRLFQRLYPDIAGLADTGAAFLAAFFGQGLDELDSCFFSHAVRWRNNRRTLRFCTERVQAETPPAEDPWLAAQLPLEFKRWTPLAQAQYLEIKIFLSQYLLCSQGDRMAMAHSVEGRFPFLDHRLVAFCNQLAPRFKLRGLREKWLLKKLGREWLPPEVWQRPKRPYRAPIHRCFFHPAAPDYVRELLSAPSLKQAGYFKPEAVHQLVERVQSGAAIGETDDMAIAGILSTQLVHHHFINHFRKPPPLGEADNLKVCTGGSRVSQAAPRSS
jgi:asparagine synthase (glutamine-hydrolysing)